MAFDVMSLLAASGMLPNQQRNAQSQQAVPIFNALLNDPQFQPLGPAPSQVPEPVPLGPYYGPAPEAVPAPLYGPPSGYDPMAMPLPYEEDLYGPPMARPLSNATMGSPEPIAMPSGPIVRPGMSLPPMPPPGFAQRRQPAMGFAAAPAQPAASEITAQPPRAQFEYPSMFDMFLAAQPGEDIAYNAPAEEPLATPMQAAPVQEEDDELQSWQPGTGFTFKDPADKEGKRKIEVISFTPSSQQGKGSAQLKTPRGTVYVDDKSKLWPEVENRYQSLLTGYQQRAAEGLATPPSNQYGHFVTLEDGTKAPMMFDPSGEMIVEDPTYGSVSMDPTDIDPKSITFPIDPKTGKPDTSQYQAAIKAIGKGVTEPLQETIQTAKGAVPSQRYSDPQTLSEATKFNISYDEFGLPKYSVVADPNYPPGFAQRLQADFDRDYKETRDAIQAELGFYLESGESIKDARIRQLRQEIDTLTPIATGGGSSATMTMAPGLTPDEASKAIAKKQQTIEEILKGGETIQLGNSVILQVGPAQTLTPIYNPTSWAAASARRRGMSTMAGNPESGAVLTPEQHGRFLVQSAVEPYVQQLGGMPPMTLTNESQRAIEATQARINSIVNDAVGQYGKSGKLGVKAREAFANEPVTFTYKLGGQVITETMPLQQAVTEWRDAVQASQRAMATRSELEIIDAGKGLNSATRRFSGTIDVPYIDGGTTYIPTREEKSLINALFQQQAIPQDMVSTPMTLSPDVRTVTQQQPIAGEVPRPTGSGSTPAVPSQVMPIFRIAGVNTDAGTGLGRLGGSAGSMILNTIANAPAEQSATTKWLAASGPGKSGATARENLSNALHGDGRPGSATDRTQIAATREAIKKTNELMQSDPMVRKKYFDAYWSLYSDLGLEFGGATGRDAFSSDLEKVVQGTLDPTAFLSRYNTNAVYSQFSGTPLAKGLQQASKHYAKVNVSENIARDSAGNPIVTPVMGLKFTQDVGERLQALVYSLAQLRGNRNTAQGNGVFNANNGARLYFFPDPYDDASGQSFLAVPDVARGALPEYAEMTAQQRADYEANGTVPPGLRNPYDLPALHAMMSLSNGKLFSAVGSLVDTLTPLVKAGNPGLGPIMRGNHGASGNRRKSANTQRRDEDEGLIYGANSESAGYQGFTDVIVNYSILPNKRTMFWR